MTVTRRDLADSIDIMDAEIAALQTDKSEAYQAYRQQLEKDGMAKPEIAAEIVALKAAIRRRQAIAKDKTAVEAKEDLADAIFVEISKPEQIGTRNALTRVSREAIVPTAPEHFAGPTFNQHIQERPAPPPLVEDGIPDFCRRARA